MARIIAMKNIYRCRCNIHRICWSFHTGYDPGQGLLRVSHISKYKEARNGDGTYPIYIRCQADLAKACTAEISQGEAFVWVCQGRAKPS